MSIVEKAADPGVGKVPTSKHIIPIVLLSVVVLATVAIVWSIWANSAKPSQSASQSQTTAPAASQDEIERLLRAAAKEGTPSTAKPVATDKLTDAASSNLQECLLPRPGRPLDAALLKECQDRFSDGTIAQRESGVSSLPANAAKGKSEAQIGQDDATQKWASRVSTAFSGPTASQRASSVADSTDNPFTAGASSIDNQFASLLSKLSAETPKDAPASPAGELGRILGGLSSVGQGVQARPSLQSLADQEVAAHASDKKRLPLKASAATSGKVIYQGSMIPVVLARPIVSDVGGDVVAMVSRDVKDPTGRCIMIPTGSVAIGAYSSQTFDGQDRLAFAFFRIILPDGQSLWMDPMGALDNDGTAGVRADVDRRLLSRFGHAFLSATVAFGFDIASQRLARSESGNTNITVSTASSPASGATRIIENAANAAIARHGAITPRLSLDRGQPLSIAVNRDISLTPQHCRS